MREMIDEPLEYSRVDTQGDPLEPLDLHAVFADVLEDLRLLIEERGAEITADELPTAHGDDGQLRQFIQNLLKNAIEFNKNSPPEVRVSAEPAYVEWIISVCDQGNGIAADDQEHIFFRMFRSL